MRVKSPPPSVVRSSQPTTPAPRAKTVRAPDDGFDAPAGGDSQGQLLNATKQPSAAQEDLKVIMAGVKG